MSGRNVDWIALVHEAVLQRGGTPAANGETRFRCPYPQLHSHGDANPSADWNHDKGMWVCRACGKGGDAIDLGKLLGVELPKEPQDLQTFAGQRQILVETLEEFGVHDVVHQGLTALRYPTPMGIDRIKFLDGRMEKYRWAKAGGTPHLYGLDQALALLREAAHLETSLYLYVVNGEVSVWACASRNVPAICFCAGEGTTPDGALLGKLSDELATVGHVAVRIVYDNDGTGRMGSRKVASALRAAAFDDVAILDLDAALDGRDGGDVDDLHRRVGEGLAAALKGLPARPDLPVISITDRPLHDIAKDAINALVWSNTPPVIFVHAGALVRVRGDEHGRAFLERVTESILRYRLVRVAEWVKEANGTTVPVVPWPVVLQDILASDEWPFPWVEGVTEVPVIRPDGTVSDLPGYDPQMHLVYCPDPKLTIPPVPSEPTKDEVRAARDQLLDLIEEFPFVDDASRANALALILTPVVRVAIAGPVPIALVDKTKRGTGASLLAQFVLVIATGAATDLMTMPRDEEELRKKITAGLVEGISIFFFDNVEHELSSAQLAALLTASDWRDRRLGKTEMVKVLLRVTWMATGNNLRVGGDIGRRCYWIRMDANVARPWQRDDFRYPRLIEHVRAHRGEILAAVITMARGWFAAGRPKATVPTLGSFEVWAETIGGILQHAGVTGFLENLEDLYELVDEEEGSWESFLDAWEGAYGSQEKTVAEVTQDLQDDKRQQLITLFTLRAALPPDLAEALTAQHGVHFGKRLGKQLSKRDGTIFGDFKLVRSKRGDGTKSKKSGRWSVVRLTPEASGGGFGGLGGFKPDLEPAGSDNGGGLDPLSPPVDFAGSHPRHPQTPDTTDVQPAPKPTSAPNTDAVPAPSPVGKQNLTSGPDWSLEDPRWPLVDALDALVRQHDRERQPILVNAAIKFLRSKDPQLTRRGAREIIDAWDGIRWGIIPERCDAGTFELLMPVES